jgi:hypothetical protein
MTTGQLEFLVGAAIALLAGVLILGLELAIVYVNALP